MKISPGPRKLETLLNLRPPETPREMKYLKGLLAYYSQWIPKFSTKLHPLTKVDQFPIRGEALRAFIAFQREVRNLELRAYSDELPFTVEAGADGVATYATLKQLGQPVSYFSSTLHGSPLLYPRSEKEALSSIRSEEHTSELQSQ